MVGDELNEWINDQYLSQSWIVSQMKTTLIKFIKTKTKFIKTDC